MMVRYQSARPCSAVQRDPFTLSHDVPVHAHLLCFGIDVDFLCPDDATLSPSTGHHCRVAGLAAGCRQDSLRDVHAPDVFWAGLPTHENYLLSACCPLLGGLCGEYSLADRRPGYRVDSLSELAARS